MSSVVDMQGTPITEGCIVVQPSMGDHKGTVVSVINPGNVHVRFPGTAPLSCCAAFFLQVLETPVQVSKEFTPENLREDYAETGEREDANPLKPEKFREFPAFDPMRPLTLMGVKLDGSGVVVRGSLRTAEQVLEALQDMKTECNVKTLRLIGTWPGRFRTDQFDLNLNHYLKKALQYAASPQV